MRSSSMARQSRRHELHFLTACPARQEGYLVVCRTSRRPSSSSSSTTCPNAREMAVVERVEWGGTDSAATVARELGRRAVRRVGLVGAIPYQAHGRLARALPGVELVDLTPAFRRMRHVKSDEEIAWTRQGAALCDSAMRRARRRSPARHVRVRARGACRIRLRSGRRQPRDLLPRYGAHVGWRADRPGSELVAPEARGLGHGAIELSAGIGGYTGQVLRTIAIGEPPAAYADLHRCGSGLRGARRGDPARETGGRPPRRGRVDR